MSFLVPTLITYDEMSLELPASASLWKAHTANAWREAYMVQYSDPHNRLPSVAACTHDARALVDVRNQVDMAYSVGIILNRQWSLIWAARQLSSAHKSPSGRPSSSTSLASSHWQQELGQTLTNFCMVTADAAELSHQAALVHEHLLLNLYVSFEELSSFAGREGSQDARRILPMLRQWADSRDSRQAIWHAGQVIREATTFELDMLRDFYAIALYHAGLTLWAYGLLTNDVDPTTSRQKRPHSGYAPKTGDSSSQGIVLLDGPESAEVQRFIALSRAAPAIRTYSSSSARQNEQTPSEAISLDDPSAVMESVINVLRRNIGAPTRGGTPPLVENLTLLMLDLSRAAAKVGKKRQEG